MKCEKCGKEANYYYKETINGKTTERHLCADCAREEGLTGAFDWRENDMFGDLFGGLFGRGDPFFSDFFGGGALPRMARMMAPAFTFPRIEIGQVTPESGAQSAAADSAPAGTDPELKARREAEMLRQQLQEAVAREDYEKAIELRDRLRELEK